MVVFFWSFFLKEEEDFRFVVGPGSEPIERLRWKMGNSVGMIKEAMFTQWRWGRKKRLRAPREGLVLGRKRSILSSVYEESKEGNALHISKCVCVWGG